ncbi:HET-domain-containing protein [Karstenula rhodostoma CBS 690.94]|uniref:HET-domain-containing protein n=1 Tax=Karstenula rhodostoma CBS 690.94 TaxID=1392251 RepID=A0A9P4PBY5_9PLEO|nr:HET-domain-containing protein [Karstenula rhodostoma CBS 690.94]
MASGNIEALYQSLHLPPDTKCIRLLHVHAPTGAEGLDGPIHCDLTVEDIDSRPYVALSYVWGVMSSRPKTIDCRGVGLPVTSNCLSALQRLRAKLGSFTIWVDAVCICQNDDQEKAGQIPLMKDIYMSATTTYIWLGEGSPEKDRAMSYLSRTGFVEYYFDDKNTETVSNIRSRPWAALFHIWIHPLGHKNKLAWGDESKLIFGRISQMFNGRNTRCSYGDIQELLDCSWISRIWTYQEAALCRNPVIVCGSAHIQWSYFACRMIFLRLANQVDDEQSRPWIQLIVVRAICQSKLGRNVLTYEQLCRYWQFCRSLSLSKLYATPAFICAMIALAEVQGVPKTELGRTICYSVYVASCFAMLYTFVIGIHLHIDRSSTMPDMLENVKHHTILDTLSSRSATNPLDMSFGFHTILQLSAKGELQVPTVDYSYPMSKVYHDLAMYVMLQTGSLDMLLLAASYGCPSAPSWVPDFSRNNPIMAWKRSIIGKNDASKSSKAQFRLGKDHNYLVAKGLKIDTISSCRCFHRTSFYDVESEHALHKHNLLLLLQWFYHSDGRLYRREEPDDNPYGYPVRLFSPPFAQFFHDVILPSCPDYHDSIMTYLNFLCHQVSEIHYAESSKVSAARIWTEMTRLSFVLQRRMLQAHILASNILALLEFKVLWTESGRLGFTFGKASKRDNVHLISGISVPLITRNTGSTIKLVSSCKLQCRCPPLKKRFFTDCYCSCFEDGTAWNRYIEAVVPSHPPPDSDADGYRDERHATSPDSRENSLPDVYIS